MKDYSTAPIDVISQDGVWHSTYRYEPFLQRWFYVRPDMHEKIILLSKDGVADEVAQVAKSSDYGEMFSYYAPLKVQVQLNKSCNYRCKMCYAFNAEKRHEMLSRERISTFLSDAKKNGVLRINYVGGEVFMRMDFPEIVAETRANRLLVSCISNGIIPGAAPKRYQSVLDSLFNIQVSCNGIGESYEREYGCSDWNRAAKCVASTIANTKTNILSFVITENNYEDIPRFLEFANEIHPSVVKFGTVCWSGNARGAKTEIYYKSVLPAAKRLIENGREKYGNLRIQSQIDQGEETPLWEDYSSGYRPFEFYFSPEGKDGLYLKSDGFFYPFPLLSDLLEFRLGAIEDGLKAIWNTNPVLTMLREATFEKSKCGELGCKRVCGLWNRSYAYSWTGSLLGKVPCELSGWE